MNKLFWLSEQATTWHIPPVLYQFCLSQIYQKVLIWFGCVYF